MLSKLISPLQSSLVPNHNIHDNIFIAMKFPILSQRMYEKGYMTIGSHMEKAYNMLEWDFKKCLTD